MVWWWLKRVPQTVGLALSGGAVRGAAHVGVLQVLEREGIVADVVAGTSVGSLVGAAYAAGLPAEKISHAFRSARWPKLARIALRSHYSLFDTRPMGEMIRRTLGIDTFEELRRPFAAVACDILTGEQVVFRSGPLGPALRASSAVPGVFPPVELDGRLLVDGSVVNNLPVSVARQMGANFVIAVDIVPPPTGGRKPRNFLEFMMVTGYLWSRANHPDPATVDCVIRPAVSEFLGWDFDDVDDLEELGRAAAEAALPTLRQALDARCPPPDGARDARAET